jgi:cell division protein FtsA
MNFLSKILKKNRAGGNCALALDIGTETVNALIFKIDPKEEKGIIIGAGKEYYGRKNLQDETIANLDGTLAACRKAIEKAGRTARTIPKKAIIGVGGEFIKGKTTAVTYERTKPKVKINSSELKNIIHKVQWKAFDAIKRELPREAGGGAGEIKLINAAITGIKIDGYQVSNPIGFQGRNVSVSVFNSYTFLVHLGALQSIADSLGLELLNIVSEPHAIVKFAREAGSENLHSPQSGAIFINVGGKTTDIILARNGNIEESKMFSLGGRIFTERLADELSVGFTKAEEIKINYSEGRLNDELSGKIEKIFSADSNVWLSGVRLSLAEFSGADPLPPNILLCGGGSIFPLIEKSLRKSSWVKSLPFAKKPKISFMRPDEAINIVDETGRLNGPQDITSIGLVKSVLDSGENEKSISKILERTVRIIQN